MEGLLQSSFPATPYLDKIINLMADSNIQELTYCIKKCSVLQNLNDDALGIQDKVCIGNF